MTAALMILGCANKEQVVLVSDPVFTQLMDAGDSKELNALLKKNDLRFRIRETGFSGISEEEDLERYAGDADIILVSPALSGTAGDIAAVLDGVLVYPVEDIDVGPDSFDNTLSAISSNPAFGGEVCAVVLSVKYKKRFEDEIDSRGWILPNVFYWQDPSSNEGFPLWLEERQDIKSAVFLSDGVPVGILTTLLENKEITALAHDLVDDEVIRVIEGRNIRTLLYTGRNYPDVVAAGLWRILSTSGR